MAESEVSSDDEFFSFETNSSSTEAFGSKDDNGDYESAECKTSFGNSTDCDADRSSIEESPRCSIQLAKYLLKTNARNLKKIKHMFHILHENGTLATKPKYKPYEVANNIIVTCQTKLRLFTGEFQIKEEQFYVNTSRDTEYRKGGKIASINPNKFQYLHSVKYNKCIVVERINSNQVVNVCNIENETVQFICLGEEYEDMWEYWRIMNSLSATTVDEFCFKVNKSITTKQDMEIIDNRELMYSYITQNLVSSEHNTTSDSEYKKPAFKLFFDFALKLNTRIYELLTLRQQLNCRKSRKAPTRSTSRTQSTTANNNRSTNFVSVHTKFTESQMQINVKSVNQISTKGCEQNIQNNGTRQQQANDSLNMSTTSVENQMPETRKKNNTEEANTDAEYTLGEELILPQVVIRFGTPNVLRLVRSAYSLKQAKKLSAIFNSEWYNHFVSQVYDPYIHNFMGPSMATCPNTSQSGTCSNAPKEIKTKNAEVQTPPIKKKVNIRCDVCTETEDIISGNRYVRPKTEFKYNNSFFCDGTEGEDFKQDIYKMPEYKLFGDDWQYQSPIFSDNYRAPPPKKKTEEEQEKMETLWVRGRRSYLENIIESKETRKSYSFGHFKSGPRSAGAALFHMSSNNVPTAVNFASNYLSEGNELRLNCSKYQQLDPHLHPQSYFDKIANGYEHLGGQQGSSGEDIRLSINTPQQSQENVTVNSENVISAEDILNNAIIRSSHFLRSNYMVIGTGEVSAHDRATESRCHSPTITNVCEVPYIIINPNNLRRKIEQFVENDPSISAVKQFFNVGMEYPMHLMHLSPNLELLARADINIDNILLNENQMNPDNASEQLALIPHPWLLTQIHPNCAALGFWRSLWPPFYFNQIAKRRLKIPFTFYPRNPYK